MPQKSCVSQTQGSSASLRSTMVIICLHKPAVIWITQRFRYSKQGQSCLEAWKLLFWLSWDPVVLHTSKMAQEKNITNIFQLNLLPKNIWNARRWGNSATLPPLQAVAVDIDIEIPSHIFKGMYINPGVLGECLFTVNFHTKASMSAWN